MYLKKLAAPIQNDATIKALVAAVKGGDRLAGKAIHDRIEEIGLKGAPGYAGFLVAYLCK